MPHVCSPTLPSRANNVVHRFVLCTKEDERKNNATKARNEGKKKWKKKRRKERDGENSAESTEIGGNLIYLLRIYNRPNESDGSVSSSSLFLLSSRVCEFHVHTPIDRAFVAWTCAPIVLSIPFNRFPAPNVGRLWPERGATGWSGEGRRQWIWSKMHVQYSNMTGAGA